MQVTEHNQEFQEEHQEEANQVNTLKPQVVLSVANQDLSKDFGNMARTENVFTLMKTSAIMQTRQDVLNVQILKQDFLLGFGNGSPQELVFTIVRTNATMHKQENQDLK